MSEVTLQRQTPFQRRGNVTLLAAEERDEAQLAGEVGLVRQVPAPQRHFPELRARLPRETCVEEPVAALRTRAATRRTSRGEATVVGYEVHLRLVRVVEPWRQGAAPDRGRVLDTQGPGELRRARG